jgi:hypothetical protein
LFGLFSSRTKHVRYANCGKAATDHPRSDLSTCRNIEGVVFPESNPLRSLRDLRLLTSCAGLDESDPKTDERQAEDGTSDLELFTRKHHPRPSFAERQR